ncbi:hypothetical protein JCM5296_005558 [Sporobolomyces johnsonii]
MADLTPASSVPHDPSRISKRKVTDVLASLDQAAFKDPLPSTGGLAKKRRTASATAPPTSTPALEALLSSSSFHRSLPSTTPVPASYDPTSPPALLSRLATYRLVSFSPSKPASLSSLACALHGWVNARNTGNDRERVQCVTCGQGVVLLAPSAGDGWTSPAGRKLKDEYERLVLKEGKGHAETCPWRMRPCARSLYRLAGGLGVQGGGGRRRLLDDLRREAGAMEHAGLEAVRLELPQGAEERREKLVEIVNPADETPSLSSTSILLALFGWTLSPLSVHQPSPSPSLSRSNSSTSISSTTAAAGGALPVLSCPYCLRQVPLSSYLPSPPSPSSAPPTTPPRSFDPLKQHHPFCPFVDAYAGLPAPPATAATPALKPGWQTRLEAVLQRTAGGGGGGGTGTGGAANGIVSLLTAGGQGEEATTTTTSSVVLSSAAKTRELLSYVRTLLGPKTSRSNPSTSGPRSFPFP